MDKATASALIHKIWSLQETLTAVQRDLEMLEHAIAENCDDEI